MTEAKDVQHGWLLLAVLLGVAGSFGCDGEASGGKAAHDGSGTPRDLGPGGDDASLVPYDVGPADGGGDADSSAALDTGPAGTDAGIADSGLDGGIDPDGGAPEPLLGAPWDALAWRSIGTAADASADCASGDPACAVDLLDLKVAFVAGTLSLDVQFAESFPVDSGSFEVFFIPRNLHRLGRTVRFNLGSFEFWTADCTSVAQEEKHSGCHWGVDPLPASFVSQWGPAGHVLLAVSLDELGLDGLESLLMGVAAAPIWIERTAEFTDRYPDELWVTATSIRGLAEVPLRE